MLASWTPPSELLHGNCSEPQRPAAVGTASDISPGVTVILVVVLVMVLSLVLFVTFRGEFEACCTSAGAQVHRRDPPRHLRCTGGLVVFPAGSSVDLCITRCGLGWCAPRIVIIAPGDESEGNEGESEAGDGSVQAEGSLTTTRASLAASYSSIMYKSPSFRRRMQMALTEMDLETQEAAAAAQAAAVKEASSASKPPAAQGPEHL